jgi:predicted MFS family arabinose efflux permease
LERKVAATAVMISGPALQGILGLTLTQSPMFALYAVAASAFPAVMIFTHTFIFGFLARNDRSTRAVAATPVMAMSGSAIGPLVGGVVAHNLGYASIGWTVAVIASVGIICFWQAQRGAPRAVPATSAAL